MLHRRLVASLLLAAYLPACTSYQATSQPLAKLTAAPQPAKLLCITQRNGVRVEVRAPRVVGDSLFGTNAARGMADRPVAIAMADIQSTEAKKFDAGRSIALVVIVGGTSALMTAAASAMVDDMFADTSFGY